MPDPSPDTPSICPRCGSPDPGKPWRQVGFGKTDPCQHPWHKATATPPPSGSPTPDTAALLALRRVADNLSAEDDPDWHTVNVMRAAADVLEAQQDRITELEAHNRRLATTMTGDTAVDLRVLYAYELGIADGRLPTPTEETT